MDVSVIHDLDKIELMTLQVACIEDKMKGRLRWFGYVMQQPTNAPVHRYDTIVKVLQQVEVDVT